MLEDEEITNELIDNRIQAAITAATKPLKSELE